MPDAEKLIQRFESLRVARHEWEGRWQLCTDFVLPHLAAKDSDRTNRKIFDSTAPNALTRCASAFEGLLAPRQGKWHSYTTGDPELDEDPEVARWLEESRDRTFKFRYEAVSNFANQFTEAMISLCCLGTAVMYIDENPGVGLRYQCVPLHEVYLAEDAWGKIDTVIRSYTLTARQAEQQFGEELPEDILKDAGDPKHCEKKHDFLHMVFPNGESAVSPKTGIKHKIASIHMAKSARKIVRESGYSTMPFAVSRFSVTPGEVYGRSPAMTAMPAICQINEMQKLILRAGYRVVSPPIMAQDDDVLNSFSLEAGYINLGGLDEQGNARIKAFDSGGNINIGLELINAARDTINEAFYLTLFQVLAETSGNQTATEVIAREQERAQLLAPVTGRQQSELLDAMIHREVDILARSGAFSPRPQQLADSGAGVVPRYETSVNQAWAAGEGRAVLSALEAVSIMAQMDPSVVSAINMPDALRSIWAGFGAPLKVLKTEEEVAEIQAQQAEAQQQAEMLQQGQALAGGIDQLAGAEEKLARADSMGGSGLADVLG